MENQKGNQKVDNNQKGRILNNIWFWGFMVLLCANVFLISYIRRPNEQTGRFNKNNVLERDRLADRKKKSKKVSKAKFLCFGSVRSDISYSNDISLKLDCTQEIDTSQLKKYLIIEPKVELRITKYHGYFEKYYSLKGDFEPKTKYKITLLKGLKGLEGESLQKELTRYVITDNLVPELSFKRDGIYLASEGAMRIPLETVNVNKLKLSVYKVFQNNVIYYLKNRYRYNDLSKICAEKEYAFKPELNERETLSVNLKELLKDQGKGIFIIDAEGYSASGKFVSNDKLVMLSDLGITAKSSKNDYFVWVSRLSNQEVVDNAEVTLISEKNQRLVSGKTNENGIVHFKSIDIPADFQPFAVVVRKDDDTAILEIEKGELSLADFDISGKRLSPTGYDAFIFTERGVYRPGESVHIQGMIRNIKDGISFPEKFPLEFTLRRPDGNIYKKFTVPIDQYGNCGTDLKIVSSSRTGRYSLSVATPGSKEVIGKCIFRVEDFMPDKIKVDIKTANAPCRKGDLIDFEIKSEYFFGAPAVGCPATAHCVFLPTEFKSPAYKTYSFVDSGKRSQTEKIKLGMKVLDKKGKASFKFKIPENLSAPSGMKAVFVVAVKELGGRGVSGYSSRKVILNPFHLGMKRVKEGYGEINESEIFKFICLDNEGEKIPRSSIQELTVDIFRMERNWAMRKTETGYTYKSATEEHLIETIKPSQENAFVFTPKRGGEYRVVLSDKNTGVSSSCSFVCYSNCYSSFSSTSPDKLDLSMDKTSYQFNDLAKLLIKSPFPGRGLLTIEGNGIYKSQIFNMENGNAEQKFVVEKRFGRNFYCSVSLLRKKNQVTAANLALPDRAFGIVPIKVDCLDRTLFLGVDAPEKVSPGEKIEISCKVTDYQKKEHKAVLTVSLVDEGILRLTDYQLPAPLEYFYARNSLGTSTSDLYSMLIPEYLDKQLEGISQPGGGGRLDRRFLSPVDSKRIESAILWQNNVPTDDQGQVKLKFTIPEFTGSLRLMIVAASEKKFGNFQQNIKVESPLVIRATCPRFLAPGDECRIPVLVFNKTGQEQEVKLVFSNRHKSASASKVVELLLKIPDKASTAGFFQLKAPKTMGTVNLSLKASAGRFQTEEKYSLPLRPASPYRSLCGSGVIECQSSVKERSLELKIPDQWLPGTSQKELTISSLPQIHLLGSLKKLLRYPFGCVEQTSSKAFPLLYFGNLSKTKGSGFPSEEEVDFYIQSGIERLASMQTVDGGFSMWPGGKTSYPWGTVYAAHFMVEAGKAGYLVEEDVLKAAFSYLKQYLNNRRRSSKNDLSIKAYILYVLALGKNPSRSWSLRLQEEQAKLPLYSKMHLALSMQLVNDTKASGELSDIPLPKDLGERNSRDTLHSYLRESSILLAAYMDINPKYKNVPVLAGIINLALNKPENLSTQEKALALMAMGKYLNERHSEKGIVKADIFSGKEKIASLSETEGAALSLKNNISGKTLTIKASGKGLLYYSWISGGIPRKLNQQKEEDHRLKIRRSYFLQDGREANLFKLPHGEIIFAEITSTSKLNLKNVVISDLLPAGLEIENPHLATRRKFDLKIQNIMSPEHVERRDDRLLIFTDIEPGTSRYRYALRAVSQGKFLLPPIKAECMYDPEIKSLHGAGKVQVH